VDISFLFCFFVFFFFFFSFETVLKIGAKSSKILICTPVHLVPENTASAVLFCLMRDISLGNCYPEDVSDIALFPARVCNHFLPRAGARMTGALLSPLAHVAAARLIKLKIYIVIPHGRKPREHELNGKINWRAEK